MSDASATCCHTGRCRNDAINAVCKLARNAQCRPDMMTTVNETLAQLRSTIDRLQQQLIRRARRKRRVARGTITYPWGAGGRPAVWPGDGASTDVLYGEVYRLLREAPRSFAELMQLTGGRRGRVSGALVQLQREGKPLERLGTPEDPTGRHRALWRIPGGVS